MRMQQISPTGYHIHGNELLLAYDVGANQRTYTSANTIRRYQAEALPQMHTSTVPVKQ